MSRAVKFEAIATITGLFGAAFLLWLVMNWATLDTGFRESFRGGNVGAQILGVALLIGVAAPVALIVNLARGRFHLWWLRVTFVGCLLLLAAIVSRYV